ncbi:glycosyltransferase [Planctomycetota bacterium]
MTTFPEHLAAGVHEADVVVGIPSYNETETIDAVIGAAGAGLAAYFPNLRSVVLVSDGGSDDGTIEAAERAKVPSSVEKVVVVHPECAGKGAGLRVLFDAAKRLSAKACATFDADLKNIEPDWVRQMIEPVLNDGFEYVAPYYKRHRYDATITNSICYPLIRALFGADIRQPIGGDFAFSGDLARFFSECADAAWNDDIANFGIDIWMTTTAVAHGVKIGQAALGAKVHTAKDPFRLKDMFTQVVATLFDTVRERRNTLKSIKGCADVEVLGTQSRCEPEPVMVSREMLREDMSKGRTQYEDVWEDVLNEGRLMDIEEVFDMQDRLAFTPALWTGVVYDFLRAYCLAGDRVRARELIDAMAPLYCAKVLSFVGETEHAADGEVAKLVEVQAEEFECRKSGLLDEISS